MGNPRDCSMENSNDHLNPKDNEMVEKMGNLKEMTRKS